MDNLHDYQITSVEYYESYYYIVVVCKKSSVFNFIINNIQNNENM